MLDRYYDKVPSGMMLNRKSDASLSSVSSDSSIAPSLSESISRPPSFSTERTSIHSIHPSKTIPTTSKLSAPYPLIISTNYKALPDTVPSTHACIYHARMVALIHNTIIRAINASHAHCLSFSTASSLSLSEIANFLEYNKFIFQMLEHHHKVEEKCMFSQYKAFRLATGHSGDIMDENVAQHEAFEPGLELFGKYVTRTLPAEFQPRTLLHIIESFAGVLINYLHDKIPTLLALHVLDNVELMKIRKKALYEATMYDHLHNSLPFVLGCQDPDFELDGERRPFPLIPSVMWPVLVAANRHWFSKSKAGVWNFCPKALSKMSTEKDVVVWRV